MPDNVEPPVSVIAPPHKVFTRAQCVLLEQTEVLDVARYGFIGGELVLKKPIEKLHLVVLGLLRVGFAGLLRTLQKPSIDQRAEDDVFLMSWMIRDTGGSPEPGDSLLVAEASGSTLVFDLTVKAGLYARAGIAETWVVDLQSRRLIVHRGPEDGAYLDVAAYAEDEMVATLGAPNSVIRVGDLFEARRQIS
jgi:hypothetical protein